MSMTNKDITVLTTWADETIEIKSNIEHWLMVKNEAKWNWEDWIYIEDLKRFIKFSNIKDEQGRTLYIALPTPKTEKKDIKDMTPEQRKERQELLDRIWEQTKDWRKKKFIESRKEILKRLAVDEDRHWLETTRSKLQDLENFRKKSIIENIRGK